MHSQQSNDTRPYLTTPEAAELIRHSPQTMRAWRVRGGGPPYIRLSGRVLYSNADLREWLTSHRRFSTADVDTGR